MISRPIRRGAAIALPIALGWGIWFLLIAPPLDQIAADRENLAQRRAALRRYEKIERDIPTMKRRLADLREIAVDEDYLPPASPALMSALLQDRVHSLVSSTSATVRASRTLPSAMEEAVERVSVELALATDAADLRKLLWAFSNAKPDIVVDRLAIQIPETDQVHDPDTRPTFEAILTLSSFAKSGIENSVAAP